MPRDGHLFLSDHATAISRLVAVNPKCPLPGTVLMRILEKGEANPPLRLMAQ